MTFESMIENKAAPASNTEDANMTSNVEVPAPVVDVPAPAPAVPVEALAVKVSYGGEIRRATLNGNAFAALRELCSKLFELDPATIAVKYQDDDGDMITMSSDSEFQDALRLSVKDTKVLRVFIDVKGAAPAPAAAAAPAQPAEGGCPFYAGMHQRGWGPHWRTRGPFGGRGGFGGPHHGPFPHQQGGPFWNHPGRFNGAPFHPVFTPAGAPPAGANVNTTYSAAPGAPSGAGPAHFYSPSVFAHGVFTDAANVPPVPPQAPASPQQPAPFHHPHPFPHHPPHHGAGPYAMRCAMKDRKAEMKAQIMLMKENATTEEDRVAIKVAKKAMKEEFRAMWKEMKESKKEFKGEKGEWKKENKEERKAWKKEHCEERKAWKHGDRLVAKHVQDVTVPDNSELPADSPVTKTWRLRNAGQMAWPEDSQLLFISRRGDNLNGPERVFVGRVEPNAEVDVSVTFITPTEPGRYIGYYRMATGNGDKFGQRVWVSFIIPAPRAVDNNNNVNNDDGFVVVNSSVAYPALDSPVPNTTSSSATAPLVPTATSLSAASPIPASPSAPSIDPLDVNME